MYNGEQTVFWLLSIMLFLLVNYLFVHNLSRTRLNIIHSAYSFQCVICL